MPIYLGRQLFMPHRGRGGVGGTDSRCGVCAGGNRARYVTVVGHAGNISKSGDMLSTVASVGGEAPLGFS